MLQEKYPDAVVHVSLGTPIFLTGNCTKRSVRTIERLLIYSNWHKDMMNQRSVAIFNARSQILVENVGVADHLIPSSAYGVFYAEDT